MKFDVGFQVIRSAERSLAELAWVGLLLGMSSFMSFEMLLANKSLRTALEGALFVCQLDTMDIVGQEELSSSSLNCSSSLPCNKCSLELFFRGRWLLLYLLECCCCKERR
jgi:hypothetical protein